MFNTQISSIEDQIQALTEKKNQYLTLEKQVESVKEALNKIEQTAHDLDPDTMPQVFTALGLPVTAIASAQTPQQVEQTEQLEQQSQQLVQVKEESQQAQAQVIEQQEEIKSLNQKLLAAERKAQAVQEQQQAMERQIINEKEMLEEQKIAYVEHMKDLEDTAAQFVFPSDIESFIRSGKFEFDLESDLIEVVEYLEKTPDWCMKARVKRLWSMACTLVREKLGVHLPAYLLWIWRECAAAETKIETQIVNQPASQQEGIPSCEDVEPDYQKLFQLQSNEKPVASENGEQPLDRWVNLVEYDEEDFLDEFEEGEEGKEGEYKLGLDEEDDSWGEELIEAENNEWNKPSVKADNTQPELEFGDRVQIQSGEICTIENIEFVGIINYFTLKLPNGKTQSGFRACDFQIIGKAQLLPDAVEEVEEPRALEVVNKPTAAINSAQAEEAPVEATKAETAQSETTKIEEVLKVGSWVQVPEDKTGQVLYFTTSLTGEEGVAVEVTPLKGKRKKIERYPLDKVTVIIAEVTEPPIAKDKYIDRECECPDGRTGSIIKTSKKGRFVEVEVQFDDGTKQDFDLNCLWLLPPKTDSQAA